MNMATKKPPELDPPDHDQCQAEIPNGATFLTMGGRPELIRCTNKPAVIATEVKPGKDGQVGSMSLCTSCHLVFLQQMPAGYATFEEIEPVQHRMSAKRIRTC